MVTPINRKSASAQIYNQLLNYIISGEWPVGTRLPSEKELAEQFNVSRAPIREALQRLSAIGVVESQQGRGSFVCENSPLEAVGMMLSTINVDRTQITELLEFRKIFEPYCARKVAEIASDEQLAALEKYAPPLSQIRTRSNLRTFTFEMDVHFHRNIILLTDNSLFIALYEVISNIRQGHIGYFIEQRMDHEQILEGHYNIQQALVHRDADLAEKLMYQHLIDVSKYL